MSQKAPIENIGRVTSASVVKHTGKNWDQWVQILEKAGARSWSHKEISAFLNKKYETTWWWTHIVATGYEVFIERKVAGRNLKGEYSITVTKTFKCDGKKLWKFVSSPEGIAMWLSPMSQVKLAPKTVYERDDGVYGEIRTMKAPERVRFTWQEGDEGKPTVVQLLTVHRKNGTSILCFNHEKLTDGRVKEQLREHWRSVLEQVYSAIPGAAGEPAVKPSKKRTVRA